jgi:hypothetical protein
MKTQAEMEVWLLNPPPDQKQPPRAISGLI